MMPGSKGLNPHELAHKWMKDLGRIVGVQRTEQSVGIIVGAFDPNIIYNNYIAVKGCGS